MELKLINLKSWMLCAGIMLAFSGAQAQTTAAATTTPAPSIFKECAAQNNITLPVKGSGVKLTSEQRETIRSCVHQARKAAFEQCATQAGFTPGQGQRPTAAEKSTIHQCMASNGFHGHRHHHHQQSQS